jgi:hypothetical protein
VGALAEGGVNRIPIHPATPIAVIIESTMTSIVDRVPHTERSNAASTITIMTNIIGTSVVISIIEFSEKALFRKTMPVR